MFQLFQRPKPALYHGMLIRARIVGCCSQEWAWDATRAASGKQAISGCGLLRCCNGRVASSPPKAKEEHVRKLIEVEARIETARNGRVCGKQCLYFSESMRIAQSPRGFCNLFQITLLLAGTRDLRWTRCSLCMFASEAKIV